MNLDETRLKELIGEALRTLVEGGADAATLGHFATEFPQRAHATLHPKVPQGPQELIDLIEQVAQRTVDRALSAAGSGSGRARRTKVNVLINGKASSVRIDPELLSRMATITGSMKKAKASVREHAALYPASASVSQTAWIEERLQELANDGERQLAQLQATPAPGAGRPAH